MCSNCADEIDKDENKYSVSVLIRWKKTAEQQLSLIHDETNVSWAIKNGLKVITIANTAGGIGKYISTAAISYALSTIEEKKVLCISVTDMNHSFSVLGLNYEETEIEMGMYSHNAKKVNIIKTPI